MYNARIETASGKVVHFGYEHGTVFDISPLSGVPLDVKSSQGFQQIGVTVDNVTAGSISRKISGNIVGDPEKVAETLIRSLPLFSEGRLWFNDTHYCNVVISKTPEVKIPERGIPKFALQVFCREPYWIKASEKEYLLGGYTAAFHFPVVYNTHRFSYRDNDVFVNAENDGDIRMPYRARFYTSAAAENFGIINANTLEILKINDSISAGDVVDFYWDGGQLVLEKTSNGVTTDIFSSLDEDSDLFWMAAGENLIRSFADGNGNRTLSVSVVFDEAVTGVA